MRSSRRGLGLALAAAGALCAASCKQFTTFDPDHPAADPDVADLAVPAGPGVAGHPGNADGSMMGLAQDIDHLEKRIDWYGTVVPKTPDVWGEARLTRHRQDFEREMQDDLENFVLLANGRASRSDEQFSAFALSLNAAISSGVATRRIPRGVATTGTQVSLSETQQVINVPSNTEAVAIVPKDIPFQPRKEIPAGTLFVGKEAAGSKAGQLQGVGIEPTLYLDQKARYLQHLNELRRINEGDDTADAPGYSLNLLRIPVSVFPGKHTQEGWGAEVTFSLTPVIPDELLPVTFRNLIAADLVDGLGSRMALVLADPGTRKLVADAHRESCDPPPPGDPGKGGPAVAGSAAKRFGEKTRQLPGRTGFANPKAPRTLPASLLVSGLGDEYTAVVAYGVMQALRLPPEKVEGEFVSLPDVQAYLRGELTAAHRMLTPAKGTDLYAEFCTPDLAAALRAGDEVVVGAYRDRYKARAAEVHRRPGAPSCSITAALGWALIIDAAALTDQMLRGIGEVSKLKGAGLAVPEWADLYAACPSAEARKLFADFVRCRWPVRVFALDPVAQDQNILDAAAFRREEQLALAAAFVSGRVSGSTFYRRARRLDAEYETVALNRTQVGFSHGENTFGWRFYPRFQTPPTQSKLQAAVRDQVLGGPSQAAMLKDRRLEPGARECVALVVAPSFVPYLTCDSEANWFALANPKHKSLDHTQALKLSRRVKSLQTAGPAVSDPGLYRDGEWQRLLRRVEQMDARLPTQTMAVPFPVDGNVTGRELFNLSTTALAPELYGFYGAPGIDRTKDKTTTLFLVGDFFSTNNTWVTVGNARSAPGTPRTATQAGVRNFRLLSRQVIQITVKGDEVTADADGYAHVHVATPYGVAGPIKVPVTKTDEAAKPAVGYTLTKDTLVVEYTADRDPHGKLAVLTAKAGAASKVVVSPDDPLGVAPQKVQLWFSFPVTEKTGDVKYEFGPFEATYKSATGTYALSDKDMDSLAFGVATRYLPPGQYTAEENPLTGQKAGSGVVQGKLVALGEVKVSLWTHKGELKEAPGPAKAIGGQLKVTFDGTIGERLPPPAVPGPKVVPPPTGPAPKPVSAVVPAAYLRPPIDPPPAPANLKLPLPPG